jgi:predicted transcriptional regulator
MSEYLRNILKNAKEKADSLDEVVDNSLLITEGAPTGSVSAPSNGGRPVTVGATLNESDTPHGPDTFEVADPLAVSHPQSGAATLKVVVGKTLKPLARPVNTPPHGGAATLKGPPPLIGAAPVKVADGNVHVTFNYMFMDRDVLKAIKDMTEAEARIYLYLVSESYGRHKYPTNICSTTNNEMAPHIGITHSTAFARSLASLEQKGFIDRRYIARKKGEKSQFRVYLPCELAGSKSKTIIENVKIKDTEL